MEPERIELSQRERNRLKVLYEVQEGHWTQVEAAGRLRVSDRQVRRLLGPVRAEGDRGVVHRLRGPCALSWSARTGTCVLARKNARAEY